MRTPQISDYPEAVETFEENDCEALFEADEEADEVILRIKKPGSRNWNVNHAYRANQIPDPADVNACQEFWNRVWQAYQIYPKYVPSYTIKSEVSWIATSEHQPDDNQTVLAFGELLGSGRRAHVAIYRVGNDRYPGRYESYSVERNAVTLDSVTHWLPIPNDPPRRSQR